MLINYYGVLKLLTTCHVNTFLIVLINNEIRNLEIAFEVYFFLDM